MKARLLRKLLNNTEYRLSNNESYIAVGSYMCHNILSIDKATLKLSYSLDTFNRGRQAIQHPELKKIWDKLTELIESGEIKDIINGKDIIGNPLPVYSVSNGTLIESVTDKYGYPNTDDDGMFMYDNIHFKTKQEAIEHAIGIYQCDYDIVERDLKQKQSEIIKAENLLSQLIKYIDCLKSIKT